MTQSTFHLTNRQARHLWLHLQGMSSPPCGKRNSSAFAQCVESLGMIQLDSIGILSRAHHHILWSRQSAYRPPAYDLLLNSESGRFRAFQPRCCHFTDVYLPILATTA